MGRVLQVALGSAIVSACAVAFDDYPVRSETGDAAAAGVGGAPGDGGGGRAGADASVGLGGALSADAGPLDCTTANAEGRTCAGATDLGVVPVGGDGIRHSRISMAGSEAWFRVTFASSESPAFGPALEIVQADPGLFTMDVLAACGDSPLECGSGSSTALDVTLWSMALAAGTGGPGTDSFVPTPVPGSGGTVHVRVRRLGSAECFSLHVYNHAPCDSRLTDCDGVPGCEANLDTQVLHCGACGRACSAAHITPSCSGGVCVGHCDPGFADCNGDKLGDGCEANVLDDVENCGGCGRACSDANMEVTRCSMGECTGECAAGYGDCNHDKRKDGCEHTATCPITTCGAGCPTGFTCVTGTCRCGADADCTGGTCASGLCTCGSMTCSPGRACSGGACEP